MVSEFSVITSVIWFNLFLIAIMLIRRTDFIIKYSTTLIFWILILSVVRLFLPIDIERAYVVRSYKVLPAIMQIMATTVFGEKITILSLLLFVQILGSVVVAFRFIKSVRADIFERINYLPMSNDTAVSIFLKTIEGESISKNRCKIVVSDDVEIPYTAGFFIPTIYLPGREMTESELSMILMHEWGHYKRHDSWIKLFYCILCIAFWWNPILNRFYADLEQILELRCDLYVTKNMSKFEKREYLKVILDSMARLDKDCSSPTGALHLVSTKKGGKTKQRFRFVMEQDASPPRLHNFLLVLVVCIFLASFFVIVQPASLPELNKGNFIITGENSYLVPIGGSDYHVYVNEEYFVTVNESQIEANGFGELPIIKEFK